MNVRQAVLGASGNIGGLLVQELVDQGIGVRALARSWDTPKQLPGVTYEGVDAEDLDQLTAATQDISVLYLTVAIPYGTEPWQRSWPKVMQNTIAAARANSFKIVFLDNVYMYGQVDGEMTEETPILPVAKKGEVRAQVAEMLLEAMHNDDVTATIGRSADFYGPDTRISDRFFRGAATEGVAYWMGDPSVDRTWSFTKDNVKALAILGNDRRADQEIWHMPAAPAVPGTELIRLAGSIIGKELKIVRVPDDTDEARAAFARAAPEMPEMMYQYYRPYRFNSDKFQRTFGMSPTSYEQGFSQVFAAIAREQSGS